MAHSENYLRELEIQADFSKFDGFSRDYDQFQEIPHLTLLLPTYAQEMIQKQVIQWILTQRLNMELFLTQIRQNLANPSNRICRDSTQTKTPTSPFHTGDYLRYTNEGHNWIV